MKTYHVFLIVFCATFFIQTWIWSADALTDESVWVERLEHFVPSQLTPDDLIQKRYSSTPGTAVLLVGRIFLRMGIPPLESLQVSLALLVSAAAAGIAAVARTLSPDTWWWLAAGVTAAAHPLYLQASPVDAAASAVIALLAVVFLWYRQHGAQASRMADIGLGILIAAACASRFHLAVVLITPALFFLATTIGAKRVVFIGGIALAFTFFFNPFIGFIPGTYFRVGILEQFGFYTGSQLTQPLHPSLRLSSLLFVPFAILSMLLALGQVWLPSGAQARLPDRHFLLAMLLITVITGSVLLSAALQSLRYFFPLILAWEVFLPLFLFSYARLVRITPPPPDFLRPWLQLALQVFIVALTAGSSTFLLWYSVVQ